MGSSRSFSTISLFLSVILLLFVSISSGCFTCSLPKPKYNPNPSPAKSCPRDALKLGVCANILNGPVGVVVGSPPDHPCCSVLEGLVDLEVAVCLCTAIKANILGININIPISLSLLLNACEKNPPKDFQCA
ncbi:hypothetical protein QN277_003538 [Acacia crassicarpa]|uniref:Bifunctional inhibitor/plant lipid transfer protein/seed storage helical domain-containing protein n=1 Tax=Acacia crassicarpa TaxID=499986 RepID=A0AAE1IYL3_9FABA|nr:hypothetical protein QN277_003538 [Acacia crassicarpa]